MATENQINYLNSLISSEIASIDRIGITAYRSASTTYFRAKYPTTEERWDAWEERDALDADLLATMKRYLHRLDIEAMDQTAASQLIGTLKSGDWVNAVVEVMIS